MKTQIIDCLSQISNKYDAIFCDIWGVIHNGREAFWPAIDALKEFRMSGKIVILISNSPRPNHTIPVQLEGMGIQNDCYDAIVTSGDATILTARAIGEKAYKIGPPKDDLFFNALGAQYVSIAEAQYIICTGPRDDLTEQAEDYIDELKALIPHNLPLICANPDKMVQHGDRIIPCGGALADIYEQFGGKVIMAGKPHNPIYEMTKQKCDNLLGYIPHETKLLCIGDGLNTDVRGANSQNIDCLFVADGIHANDMKDDKGLNAQMTASFLEKAGLFAKYAIEFLQ